MSNNNAIREPLRESVDVLIVFADPVLFPAAMPYGAMIVADALRKRGLRVELVLPFMEAEPVVALRRAYERFCPQIIGFSFRNLDTAGFHYGSDGEETFLPEFLDLVSVARENNAIIVLGGAGFSIAPKIILDLAGADIGFIGPCEVEFAEFCARVSYQKQTVAEAAATLKSALLPGNDAPQKPPPSVLLKYNNLDKKGVEYARMVGGAIPVRTKSGCSLRCSYCVVPRIEPLSLRPWEDIRDELLLIAEADLHERVFIADGEFNLPSEQRAIDLCKKIHTQFRDRIRWRCYLSEKNITARLLDAMRKAGCVGLSVSADSLTDAPRRGLMKGCGSKVARGAISMCIESGIETGINLLFGGPNETVESAVEGAYIAREFNRQGSIISVTVGLRYYPGTPLEKIATIKKYAHFAKPCRQVPWLGVFCSPVPSKDLAQHISRILKPSDSIKYTHSLGDDLQRFYKGVAQGTHMLTDGEFEKAGAFFADMCGKYSHRLEPKRGVLRAQEEMELIFSGKKIESTTDYC